MDTHTLQNNLKCPTQSKAEQRRTNTLGRLHRWLKENPGWKMLGDTVGNAGLFLFLLWGLWLGPGGVPVYTGNPRTAGGLFLRAMGVLWALYMCYVIWGYFGPGGGAVGLLYSLWLCYPPFADRLREELGEGLALCRPLVPALWAAVRACGPYVRHVYGMLSVNNVVGVDRMRRWRERWRERELVFGGRGSGSAGRSAGAAGGGLCRRGPRCHFPPFSSIRRISCGPILTHSRLHEGSL
jgi:hypothetical protein